jgi:hypothetical protein
MSEELKKQILIDNAELLIAQKGICSCSVSGCKFIGCDKCCLSEDNNGAGMPCRTFSGSGLAANKESEKRVEKAKSFLAKHKPSITKEDDTSVSLTKREMILKNKKDVVEVCDKALACYAPEGHELCRFDGNLYRPAQGLNPSDMVKLANWILNLEKAVK